MESHLCEHIVQGSCCSQINYIMDIASRDALATPSAILLDTRGNQDIKVTHGPSPTRLTATMSCTKWYIRNSKAPTMLRGMLVMIHFLCFSANSSLDSNRSSLAPYHSSLSAIQERDARLRAIRTPRSVLQDPIPAPNCPPSQLHLSTLPSRRHQVYPGPLPDPQVLGFPPFQNRGASCLEKSIPHLHLVPLVLLHRYVAPLGLTLMCRRSPLCHLCCQTPRFGDLSSSSSRSRRHRHRR